MENMFSILARAGKFAVFLGMVLIAVVGFGFWKGPPSVVAETEPATAAATASDNLIESWVSDQYIIVFSEPALAGYDGSIPGYREPGRMQGRAKLNVKSPSS